MRGASLFLLAAMTALVPTFSETPVRVVFCAPGYPGSTEQAQPTMDAFSAQLARAAGRDGMVTAVYHESEEGGVRALQDPASAVAVLTLPFYLAHRKEIGLVPRRDVAAIAAPEERWYLVAAAGRLRGPGDLAGWEVASLAGYAPKFVRGPALGSWGALPPDAAITFTARPLSALRRASKGEDVAVLLDESQHAALEKLPFADLLETVYGSGPMSGSLLCVVQGRTDAAEPLIRALDAMPGTEDGAAALRELRVEGFREVDAERLETIVQRYDAVPEP